MKKIGMVSGILAAVALTVAFGYHVSGELSLANASGDNTPIVQTAPATDITATSALLHGIASNNGGENGHVWFEYGMNPTAPVYADAWPSQAGSQSFDGESDMNLSVPISSLSPGTTYYYRVASENSAGQTYGETLSFKTTADTAVQACADNTTLTLAETKAAIASGKITVSLANSTTENKAIGTIKNDTGCALPVSQATFKMFDQKLATQVLLDYAPSAGNTTNVPAHTTIALKTNLPSCMAQSDIFYGAAPTTLNESNNYPQNLTYNFFQNSGSNYFDAAGNFCGNTPDLGTLTLVKTVSNTHGGTKQVADFALFENGVQVTSGQATSYNFASLNDNKIFTATETNLPGYTAGAWGGDCTADGKVTLHPGEHKTCTITNSDAPAVITSSCADNTTLTLAETKAAVASGKITVTLANSTTENKAIGTVHNDTGCALPVSQVTYKMFDQQLSTQELFDYAPAPTGSVLTVPAHTVGHLNTNLPVCMAQSDLYYGPGPITLNDANNYPNNLAFAFSMNNANNYFNAAGNFCQHTSPTTSLKLIKNVINDNGGTKVATDFPLFVNTTQVTTGQDNTFAPGTYKASETNLPGYTAGTWGGDCAADGTVVLNAGDHKTCTITNNDNPATVTNTFALTCSANPTSALIGTAITYTANATNGTGSYVYSWTGDDGLSGNATTTSITYSSIGTKNATVTATSGGQTLTAQCSVPITVTPVINPGCTNCGFLYPPNNPPPVTVTSTPNPGQVAGVFLSQVPYTGIGSNFKVALFMVALFSWSAWISYLIIKRKAAKSGVTVAQMFQNPVAASTMAFAGSMSMPKVSITAIPHEPKKLEGLVTSPFLEHMTQKPAPKYEPVMTPKKAESNILPEIAKPQAQIAIASSKDDVVNSLEMRARELQTLVSADGLEIIAKASDNNKHNALIILTHLVELYKGSEHEVEGDWMVLNGEKINSILFSTYITMTPVFIQWLAEGDDKKTMAFVRMLQMQGQTVKDFVMNIVIELDKAYRFRVENTGDADAQILDSTMQWSNQELETVIHTLVTAVDQTYSSVYSSVKIALVKVLDLARTKALA